jgi:hypothetical protein
MEIIYLYNNTSIRKQIKYFNIKNTKKMLIYHFLKQKKIYFC